MGKRRNCKLFLQKTPKSAHKRSARTPGNLRKPTPQKPKTTLHQQKQQKSQEPVIPYNPSSRILLVGEGDFSFSASLLTHHLLSATGNNNDDVEDIDPDIDLDPNDDDDDDDDDDEDGDHEDPRGGSSRGINLIATSYDTDTTLLEKYPQSTTSIKLLRDHGATVTHGVDITKFEKLPKVLRKRRGGFDVVGFMFPHVGGLSTDVGRQVKSNQELLLGFFKSSASLLCPTGTAVITLFEGAPYDLWDVKLLAKSAGFRTRRSFKFQSEAYPGYRHARTLGNVEGSGTAWKGEERKARTYVFELTEDKGYSGEKTGSNAIEAKRVKKTTKRERRFQDESSDEEGNK